MVTAIYRYFIPIDVNVDGGRRKDTDILYYKIQIIKMKSSSFQKVLI
jgi:hypothetical protein